MEGSATVSMSAPADKIWNLIADVRNTGRFSPEVMEAEWLGHADADEGLHDGEKRGQSKQQRDLRTADPEQLHARVEADAGEERDHQRLGQRRIELQRHDLPMPAREQRKRDDQAADHRGRDVEPRK